MPAVYNPGDLSRADLGARCILRARVRGSLSGMECIRQEKYETLVWSNFCTFRPRRVPSGCVGSRRVPSGPVGWGFRVRRGACPGGAY